MAEEGVVLAALAAYDEALATGDPEFTPKSAFNAARLQAECGHHGWAVVNYSRAAMSGHGDVAPKAAYNLACLLEEHGDHDAAKAALTFAARGPHEEVAFTAAHRLRRLAIGDVRGHYASVSPRYRHRSPISVLHGVVYGPLSSAPDTELLAVPIIVTGHREPPPSRFAAKRSRPGYPAARRGAYGESSQTARSASSSRAVSCSSSSRSRTSACSS